MTNDTTTASALLSGSMPGTSLRKRFVALVAGAGAASSERLNVFVHLDAERVLAQARSIDAKRRPARSSARWPAFRSRSRT